MGFKKRRGINLPYEKQGLICFVCLDYARRPQWERKKIDRLLAECGGEHVEALREIMCTTRSVTAVALEHHVSESVLYRARKRFYEGW